jgi:hypothetical protein
MHEGALLPRHSSLHRYKVSNADRCTDATPFTCRTVVTHLVLVHDSPQLAAPRQHTYQHLQGAANATQKTQLYALQTTTSIQLHSRVNMERDSSCS